MKFLIMYFCEPSVTASLNGPDTFLSTIFSDNVKPCSPNNVRDQVYHPHKTIGEVVSPCILISVFLYKRRDILRYNHVSGGNGVTLSQLEQVFVFGAFV
jgi:hypothetical protein